MSNPRRPLVLAAFGAILSSACAASPPPAKGPHAMTAAGDVPKPVVTPIVRTGRTVADQPLRLPQGAAEVVAAAIDLPVGAKIPLHRHPWSRFVYVERGTVLIHNRVTGASYTVPSGRLVAETVGQWHEAESADGQPVRLLVFDLVPPGVTNMEMPPK